jgi:DNA-binding HxlR family transcriptional regulator
MLTQTLRALERDDLVSQRLFDEVPLRVEYALTERGRGLMPLAAEFKRWLEANFIREGALRRSAYLLGGRAATPASP